MKMPCSRSEKTESSKSQPSVQMTVVYETFSTSLRIAPTKESATTNNTAVIGGNAAANSNASLFLAFAGDDFRYTLATSYSLCLLKAL